MSKSILAKCLKKGDIIGVIAPSRPIYTCRNEFEQGLKLLEKLGFRTKLSKNINSHEFYSAGTPEQRADDLNSMFADPEVKAIMCATGGISSNQILELIDYELIAKYPKPIIGYSDNANILIAINKMTNLVTFYCPDVCELPHQNEQTIDSFFKLLTTGKVYFPNDMTIFNNGIGIGRLIGGYLPAICGLLATKFAPDFQNAVIFWEDVNESPAKIDFLLNQLKLSGCLNNISAMAVGHLDNCIDTKYRQDNKPIDKIVLNILKNKDLPAIQVNFFGHEINNFQCIPIGAEVALDTNLKFFKLTDAVLN